MWPYSNDLTGLSQFIHLGKWNRPEQFCYVPKGWHFYLPKKATRTEAFTSHGCRAEIFGKFDRDFLMMFQKRNHLEKIPFRSEKAIPNRRTLKSPNLIHYLTLYFAIYILPCIWRTMALQTRLLFTHHSVVSPKFLRIKCFVEKSFWDCFSSDSPWRQSVLGQSSTTSVQQKEPIYKQWMLFPGLQISSKLPSIKRLKNWHPWVWTRTKIQPLMDFWTLRRKNVCKSTW